VKKKFNPRQFLQQAQPIIGGVGDVVNDITSVFNPTAGPDLSVFGLSAEDTGRILSDRQRQEAARRDRLQVGAGVALLAVLAAAAAWKWSKQ